MPKLTAKILHAMAEGADTSTEIAEMIDHPVKNISAVLNLLEDYGIVRKTGRWKMMHPRGPRSLCRELVT